MNRDKIVELFLIFIIWLLIIMAIVPADTHAGTAKVIKDNQKIHNHTILDGQTDEYLKGKDSKDLANEANDKLLKTQKEHKKIVAAAKEKKEEQREEKEQQEQEASMEYIGDFEVTAYSYSEGGGENYQTAGGYTPSPYYTVAVDPSVIPLGTVLYIEGIGEVQAQDTGGAVQGNVIDLHIGDGDCDSFGRQVHKVYIMN